MTELAWMDKHTLKGLAADELGHMAKREYFAHVKCPCGEKIYFVGSEQSSCDRCGNVFEPAQTMIVMNGCHVMEQVIVNGPHEMGTLTFDWEM